MAATFNAPRPIISLRASITDAATANYDHTTTRGLTVIDAIIHKTDAHAAAVNTVQVLETANAITDTIGGNINLNLVDRAASIADAFQTIAAAGTLRLAVVRAGGNGAYDVVVHCIPG